MSKPSCDACTRLREYNANFIMNGVTDDIASSLKNNTGLNPCLTDLHTDCEDLNDINDCLIGHMDDDVDNYEVCDWKELAHNFFPNLYETLKAMIASICGLWTKTSTIEKNVEQITNTVCNSVDATYLRMTNDSGIGGGGDAEADLVIKKYVMPDSCGGCTVYECWPELHTGGAAKKLARFDESVQDEAGRVPMAHIDKSAVVPKYLPEGVWNSVCTENAQGTKGQGSPECIISCGSGFLIASVTGNVITENGAATGFKTDRLYLWAEPTTGAGDGSNLKSSMATQYIRYKICE